MSHSEPIVRKRTFAEIADDLSAYQETLELAKDQDEHADIQKHMQRLGEELMRKADNLAAVFRRLDSDVEEIKAEEKRLLAKRKHAEAAKDWLESYVMGVMRENNISKLKTALNTLSIQKNGGGEPMQIGQSGLIPEEMCLYRGWMSSDAMRAIPEKIRGRQDFQFDREPKNLEVRARLTKGESVPGARLLPRGEHLRIL